MSMNVISRKFRQAKEWVRLGPTEYNWMKNHATQEMEKILAGKISDSDMPSLNSYGVVIFGAF